MLKKHNITLALLFTIANLCSQNNHKIAIAKADTYINSVRAENEIIGIQYAVLINGQLIHQKEFGYANLEHKVVLQKNTVFKLASISKLFSSVALHKLLVEQNRSVEETLGAFLEDNYAIPNEWKALTLRQILSHTSGLPDQIDYGIYLAPTSEEFVLEAMKDKPFKALPGEASRYNATGFLLVKLVIEKLAKISFEQHMQEVFFEEYNLKTATYGGYKKIIPNRVQCYQTKNGRLEMFPLNYATPMYAAAGLNCTMKDLIVWLQHLLDGDYFPTKLLQKIMTPVPINNTSVGDFGLGWEAKKIANGIHYAGHGGAGISSVSHFWGDGLAKDITVIVLTNGAKQWKKTPKEITAAIATIIVENTAP